MGVKRFTIQYEETVVRQDIQKLSVMWKKRIRSAIETKLTEHPEVFGKPLRRSIKGYRSLRVSDYRVIFRLETKVVKIFIIEHRSSVYKEVLKRLMS